MGILFLNWIVRNILVTKLLVFADYYFFFLTPAPVVSVLEDIGIYTLRNIIINMTSFAIMHVVMFDLVWRHSAIQSVLLQNYIIKRKLKFLE